MRGERNLLDASMGGMRVIPEGARSRSRPLPPNTPIWLCKLEFPNTPNFNFKSGARSIRNHACTCDEATWTNSHHTTQPDRFIDYGESLFRRRGQINALAPLFGDTQANPSRCAWLSVSDIPNSHRQNRYRWPHNLGRTVSGCW